MAPYPRRVVHPLRYCHLCSPPGFNGISDLGAASLARSLNQNTTLRTLYLSGNSIGAAGASALAEALARNTGLATLHLSVRYLWYGSVKVGEISIAL